MDKRLFGVAAVITIIIFLIGCAKPGSKSYYEKVQHFADSHYVRSSSTSGTLSAGSRMCVVPFDCTTPRIGETVSNHTVSNLKYSGFIFIDPFEISQLLKQGNANFVALSRDKDYTIIMRLARLDYLMVGSVDIASVTHRRIVSAEAHILDTSGSAVVRAEFTPPSGKITRMPAVGAVLAAAIRGEVEK